jgi:putative transcriptional regulator
MSASTFGYDDFMSTAPLLLLSMPQMTDPNFAKTVVLLCEYTEKGAFGIVVNRQMEEPAWTMVKTEPAVAVDRKLRLFIGGPVDPERTWVLMSEAQGPDDEQHEICPGVLLSVSKSLTLEILQSPPTSRARVVIGYAGWGPGQLEQEIASSSWLTMAVDPVLIFSVPPDQMWEAAIRRLGTDPSAFQTSTGVH